MKIISSLLGTAVATHTWKKKAVKSQEGGGDGGRRASSPSAGIGEGERSPAAVSRSLVFSLSGGRQPFSRDT